MPQRCFSFTSLGLSGRWKAANYSRFWGMTLDEGIRYRLGTIRPSTTVMNMNELHVSWLRPCPGADGGYLGWGMWVLPGAAVLETSGLEARFCAQVARVTPCCCGSWL